MPSVDAYVGVTDGDWYRHLVSIGADEANFWRPSGRAAFHRIQVGEPFLFKTHFHDGNRVVGGGLYSDFVRLRLSDAWRTHGELNGASSLAEMRQRIGKYRAVPLAASEDPEIGCIFVRDVRFFAPPLPAPPGWSRNLVQGRGFDTDDADVRGYFDVVLNELLGPVVELDGTTWHRPGPVYGDPRLAPHRLGQRAFQGVVLAAYGGRCAVTGDKIRPVLQAAHIRPLAAGGEHRLDNGLLLRSDVHTLFDGGYLGIDPKCRLVVSPRLRAEFGNGDEFYERAASKEPIATPSRRADRPNRDFLEWHLEECFRRS